MSSPLSCHDYICWFEKTSIWSTESLHLTELWLHASPLARHTAKKKISGSCRFLPPMSSTQKQETYVTCLFPRSCYTTFVLCSANIQALKEENRSSDYYIRALVMDGNTEGGLHGSQAITTIRRSAFKSVLWCKFTSPWSNWSINWLELVGGGGVISA